MTTVIEKRIKETFIATKDEGGYKNRMQAPKLVKVVLNVGVGSLKDKKKLELIEDRLAKITGQKPSPRPAKISIANFKSRQGDVVGLKVTLRGRRMRDFLERFIRIALPRSKDFKGIPLNVLDEMGNLTFGIKEHTIFPETADEDLKDVFGMAITIVSTARNRKEAEVFFRHIGVPFKK